MEFNNLPRNYTPLIRIAKYIFGKKNILFTNSEKITDKSTFHKKLVSMNCENVLINKLFEPLSDYQSYVSVFLHGSWADDTTSAFSDIDDFVIINSNTINEKSLRKIVNILNNIDMQFCRIDPLQHHGHWLVSSKELLNGYDNSFMPLNVVFESSFILGQKTIIYNVCKEKTEKGLKLNIINTCKHLEKLSDKLDQNNLTAYELKQLVGSFVLMPAFIFQLKGESINKPSGILRANELFSKECLQLLDWSTECRKNWSYIVNKRKFKVFKLITYLFSNPHLWRKFSKRFSFKINENDLTHLSSHYINKTLINKFITESLEYVR